MGRNPFDSALTPEARERVRKTLQPTHRAEYKTLRISETVFKPTQYSKPAWSEEDVYIEEALDVKESTPVVTGPRIWGIITGAFMLYVVGSIATVSPASLFVTFPLGLVVWAIIFRLPLIYAGFLNSGSSRGTPGGSV